jgi:hypothetical protein
MERTAEKKNAFTMMTRHDAQALRHQAPRLLPLYTRRVEADFDNGVSLMDILRNDGVACVFRCPLLAVLV